MKKLALAVGIAALALLAAFLLRLDAGPSDGVAPAPETTSAAREVESAVLRSAELERADERTAATVVAKPVAIVDSAAPPDATAARATRALSGTLVVVDQHGVEHAAEDGTFSLFLWQQDSGRSHDVDVEAGAWRTEIPREPPIPFLSFGGARLRDRPALLETGDGNRVPWPANDWLAVRARWPRTARLFVRDRSSGDELAPVWLAATVRGMPAHEHPGPGVRVQDDLGPSPVELPPSKDDVVGMRTVYVRSPGYAWGRIELQDANGGERIVLLDRSGEIGIALTGSISDRGANLRLYGRDQRLVYEAPMRTTDAQVVEDLRPGWLRVAVEIGDWWDQPVVLAEAEVEIRAGERARVNLALATPIQAPPVPLEGVLVVPEAWDLERFALEFELQETPLGGGDGSFRIERAAMQREADGGLRWSKLDVQPGRYEVQLDAVAFRAILDVGALGLRDAYLVVPPPCDVLVRCVDDATGEEVVNERVSWFGAIPSGTRGWSHESARWDADARRWRFRVPEGDVSIAVNGAKYAHVTQRVQAHPGTNEFEMRLERPTSLRVVLRDGTTDVPWSDDLVPVLQPSEGQQKHESWSQGGGQVTLHVLEPGGYVLRIPEIPGYEPVPAIDVRLEKGVVGEHVVMLVRKR